MGDDLRDAPDAENEVAVPRNRNLKTARARSRQKRDLADL